MINLSAQGQRPTFEISGVVVAKEGQQGISGVEVSTDKGAYTLTNALGEFQIKVSVGDVIVFEGTITLDKDFGAGYFYEIIMEETILH